MVFDVKERLDYIKLRSKVIAQRIEEITRDAILLLPSSLKEEYDRLNDEYGELRDEHDQLLK